MPIELPPEDTKRLVAAVKLHFLEHRNEGIGDLQAGFLLEFCLKEIGAAIYNQGVRDAQTHIGRLVEDLDSVVFESEPSLTTLNKQSLPRSRLLQNSLLERFCFRYT